MPDAVLSVEIRAKLDQLSKGLSQAEKSIEDFVNRGDRHISAIEGRFNRMGKSTKEIADNIKSSFGGISLDQYFKGIEHGSGAIEKAKAESAKWKAEIDRLKAAQQELTNKIKDKTAALNDEKSATERAKQATEAQRRATEAEKTALAALRREKAENSRQQTTANGSYREAQQRLTALGRAIRENANGFNLNNKAVKAQISEYNKLNSKLKEFDRAMGNHQRNVGNYGSAWSGAIPYLDSFTTKAGLAAAAVAAVTTSFNTNLKLDSLIYGLKESSSNSIEAKVNLDFLRESADRLGLDFISSANSFKLWNGAAKYSNLTAEQSREVFESVANAGAKMRLSNDQIQGSFLALSQMLSKGKVQAEELRGQLGERLPGAFALAAKAMGVTEKELNKMLEKGEVVADDFLPKFAKQLDISFGQDKTQKIESMQASVNRLKTEFDLLWDSDRAKGFFTDVTDGLARFIKNLNGVINSSSWKEFIIRTSGIKGADIVGDAIKQTEAYSKLNDIQKSTYGFEKKSAEERKKHLRDQKALVDLRVREYKAAPNASTLGEVTFANSTLAELNKIHAGLGGFDGAPNNRLSTDTTKADIAKGSRDRANAIRDAIREQELLKKTLLDSQASLNARELSGIQKTIEAINQKYDGWKRKIHDNVKDASSASEAIKQLEINNKAETIIAIDAMIKKSLKDQKDKAKETAHKIADATKKIAQDNINIDLVFSRKFDETSAQRSLRALNAQYKQLALQLEKDLQSQLALGVNNVDSDNRQGALQEEYFQKAEKIYQQEQRMRVDMVDKRNLFNTALEKTNVLLDENARKLQAGAISVDEFQKVQSSLLNQQESLNVLKGVYDQFTNGVGESFANMLTGTESFASGMESVVKSMVSTLIQQMARLAAIKLFGALFTGGSSLLVPGFATGGYTGNVAANKPAGIVHGKEFVFDAKSTQRIGVDNLKALQSGKTPNISDFTPRITKNISNFTSDNGAFNSRAISVDVSVDGKIRNNSIDISNRRASRSYRKFGRG